MSKTITIRRLMREYKDLMENPEDNFIISPVSERELFEWHFTLEGSKDTDFAGALIHGRLLLPEEYPFKAPDVVFLTPNGRFECNKKICLSFSSFHQELWQVGWNIRNMMIALIAFMDTNESGIGSMRLTRQQRRKLAEKSLTWTCKTCKKTNQELWEPHRLRVLARKKERQAIKDKEKEEKEKKEIVEGEQGASVESSPETQQPQQESQELNQQETQQPQQEAQELNQQETQQLQQVVRQAVQQLLEQPPLQPQEEVQTQQAQQQNPQQTQTIETSSLKYSPTRLMFIQIWNALFLIVVLLLFYHLFQAFQTKPL